MSEHQSEKIITIAIPCYNSEQYLQTAVESVIGGGEQVEILIVDDGSTDGTAALGKKLELQYPSMIRYIYKENGGHGDAVMKGLHEARGYYYKVLDSDDCFDKKAFDKIISLLAQFSSKENEIDMFIANYVYDKEGSHRKVSIDYKNMLPEDTIFSWDDIGHFKTGHNLLMHAVIYRTSLLKECGLSLPKHTFYVDNIFVYYPLPFVKKMYYLNEALYYYKIGRKDQSVHESVMLKRIDQQLYVNRLMIDMYDLSKLENDKMQDYMAQYLTMIMTVSSALLVRDGSEESLLKKEGLWKKLHERSEQMYDIVHKQTLTKIVEKDGKARNKIIDIGYELAQKIYHFN